MKYDRAQLKAFIYWMDERHRIYQRRYDGHSPPWTKDKILQEYKFTNVFRQLDRVTIELNKRTANIKDLASRLFHIVVFRMFNWPETYDVLKPTINRWSSTKAVALIRAAKKRGDLPKVFTGAYIITAAGKTGSKELVVCRAIDKLWKDKDQIVAEIMRYNSMQIAVEVLRRYPNIGKFVAYELACDLRYTPILQTATDVLTWANPGPGAMRGIHRLLTGSKDRPMERIDYVAVMRDLLKIVQCRKMSFDSRSIEMREIEHSLCEFDKYMRVKNGEGRPRSRYNAKGV